MAKVSLNPSLAGISGRVSNFVYRQQNGQTVVLEHTERKDRPSRAQKQNRGRFTEAKDYAKRVLADPLRRECYRRLAAERKCPSNALLIANFLNPPTIEIVELDGYEGRAGDVIRVVAADAIEVVGVTLTLRSITSGTVLESGAATRDHDVWTYRCTAAAANLRDVRIEVVAANRAGAKGRRVETGERIPETGE
jgi:hypothetical protein